MKNYMRMLVDWTIIELAIIAAFHPQMRNHGQIIGKAKQQILAPPINPFNRLTNQGLPKLLDVVFNRFPIVNVNPLNLTARGNIHQPSAYGLYFWHLWHLIVLVSFRIIIDYS